MLGGISMELKIYQKKAMDTCMPSCENFSYMMLNLVGEVGELAGKVAKGIRKGDLVIGVSEITGEVKGNDLIPQMSFAEWTYSQDDLMSEAGDILWQLSGLCTIMGWSLEEVAKMNLEKLAKRKKSGTIETHEDH